MKRVLKLAGILICMLTLLAGCNTNRSTIKYKQLSKSEKQIANLVEADVSKFQYSLDDTVKSIAVYKEVWTVKGMESSEKLVYGNVEELSFDKSGAFTVASKLTTDENHTWNGIDWNVQMGTKISFHTDLPNANYSGSSIYTLANKGSYPIKNGESAVLLVRVFQTDNTPIRNISCEEMSQKKDYKMDYGSIAIAIRVELFDSIMS